jgi:ribosomal protein S18 acetylase RimI-like enzyme
MVVYSANEFLGLPNFNELKKEINISSSQAFNHGSVYNNVEMILRENGYIGYLTINNKIVASGFGKEDNINNPSKYKTMYIHTFGVHSDYRGRGLCQQIVNEFIKRFGKNYILYLTVRTESNNVNERAIKCYEKNGFIMLSEVYRDHYDGKNNAMIRLPTISNNTIRKRRSRKKSRNKRK